MLALAACEVSGEASELGGDTDADEPAGSTGDMPSSSADPGADSDAPEPEDTTTTSEDPGTTGEPDADEGGSTDDLPPPGDTPGMDDDFEDGALEQWSRLAPNEADVWIEDGGLMFEPHHHSLWYEDSSADLVYRLFEGDLTVTAPISVQSLDGGPLPGPFRLAGLMIRNPAEGPENYVFITLGTDGNDLSTETKTTTDSVSTFWGPSWPVPEAELRICRWGSEITTLVRELGGDEWTVLEVITRDDFPSELQVGMMGYANASPANVVARFESITVETLDDASQCQAP